MSETRTITPAAARDQLLTRLAELLRVPVQSLDPAKPFSTYGLDSLTAVMLTGELEDWLDRRLAPTLLWDHPTVDALAVHLASLPPAGEAPAPVDVPEEHWRVERFPEVRALQARREELERAGTAIPYFRLRDGVAAATADVEGRTVLNFGSYNYLGLSGHPEVSRAAEEAIRRHGTSVSASRLASGELTLHRELERVLADLVGAEDSLAFVSGHATNVTTLGHLLGPGDLLAHDELVHNSVLQGGRLSGATLRPFAHNDGAALDALLHAERGRHRRALVALEGVYSTDGDVPDLPRFVEVKQRHAALLFVDEAHATGVLGATGRGLAEHWGVDPSTVDLWMGTLSKTLASCGGYVAGSRALVEYLRFSTPGFVYSVGLPPASAAAALTAVRLLRAEPERVERLRRNTALFLARARAAGLDTGLSRGSAVVPVMVGDAARALHLSAALLARGVQALPMVPPAVAPGASRLRFFLSALHTEEQIEQGVAATAEALASLP